MCKDTDTTQSPFVNESGGLVLMEFENVAFLKMQSACEDRWFGPLTENQVSSFKLLCDVPLAFHEDL